MLRRPVESDQSRFIEVLDDAFRHYGLADGLPARLREAVRAMPRHRFVHRFRIEDGPLQDIDADPEGHLATIYSDEVMRHVDTAGDPLPSTNSQPSYVLWLLHLLGLEQGQVVLEIGSGSGWLAAIMGHLVGPGGRVFGIELIADLAEQSRRDLATLQLDNVTIITGDGTRGHSAGAPYGRAMITAATWEVPSMLFDQMRDVGGVLIPIELSGGDGCHVAMLRRRGKTLVAEGAVPGWFVPLLGEGQTRTNRVAESLPFWKTIRTMPVIKYDLPLGMMQDGTAAVAAQFRAFLSRTEPSLLIAASGAGFPWMPGMRMPPFGLVDEAEPSVALWDSGEVTGYGGLSAARALAHVYQRRVEAGLPGMAAFELSACRTGEAPDATDQLSVERRGETTLVWRLKTGTGSWLSLLDPTVTK